MLLSRVFDQPLWWLCAQHSLRTPRGVTACGLTLCHLLFL